MGGNLQCCINVIFLFVTGRICDVRIQFGNNISTEAQMKANIQWA